MKQHGKRRVPTEEPIIPRFPEFVMCHSDVEPTLGIAEIIKVFKNDVRCKGSMKLIQRVKIAQSFLHVMSKLFQSITLSLSR